MEPILSLKGINKSFFGVQVLFDINLDLYQGEILGLVGENGAGKSTMMNIIGGVLKSDSGSMVINGKDYSPEGPMDATERGISFIHQELSLFTNMSVAENVFIDSFPLNAVGGIKTNEIVKKTKEFLQKYNLEDCNPKTIVGTLPMGTRQMIEIMKALVKDTKILIFDEPTTSLSTREKEALFDTILSLKANGYSIIYISHILEDILQLSDRISVLRDGRVVDTDVVDNFDKEKMIRLMVGRDMKQVYPTIEKEIGETLFEIRHLSCAGLVKDVSLSVRSGEIVGMFGLMGAGRSEMARAAFGVDPLESGSIWVKGKEYTNPSPQVCIENEIAFITENRREEGLMMPKSVAENLVLVKIRELTNQLGVVNEKAERAAAESAVSSISIKTTNPGKQPVNSLSGGNQQKVVIGKWIITQPKIFIVDEPTRGIDVGAKYEVYKLLLKLAAEGAGILFISSEMEELMGMCDRILVMQNGRISGNLSKEEYSQERIMEYAL